MMCTCQSVEARDTHLESTIDVIDVTVDTETRTQNPELDLQATRCWLTITQRQTLQNRRQQMRGPKPMRQARTSLRKQTHQSRRRARRAAADRRRARRRQTPRPRRRSQRRLLPPLTIRPPSPGSLPAEQIRRRTLAGIQRAGKLLLVSLLMQRREPSSCG